MMLSFRYGVPINNTGRGSSCPTGTYRVAAIVSSSKGISTSRLMTSINVRSDMHVGDMREATKSYVRKQPAVNATAPDAKQGIVPLVRQYGGSDRTDSSDRPPATHSLVAVASSNPFLGYAPVACRCRNVQSEEDNTGRGSIGLQMTASVNISVLPSRRSPQTQRQLP